jgi:hypothetical protein
LAHLNRCNRRRDYRNDYSAEIRALIEEMFHVDILKFGYSFNDPEKSRNEDGKSNPVTPSMYVQDHGKSRILGGSSLDSMPRR